MAADDLWGSFAHDPREPAHAPLRASDADREVVRGVLASAYADGRLDREEFDERSDVVTEARTLGELPPVMADLVAPSRPGALVPGATTSGSIQELARRRYAADRREALVGFLGPSIICVVIWSVVMFGGFFWPGFVIAGTGINLVRVLVQHQDLIDQHVRRLEKKQAKQERAARELEVPRDEEERE